MESIVEGFDARAYVTQRSASEITLLAPFRQEMRDSITRFRECMEMRDLKRIPCLAQWWRSVGAMQQRYSSLEAAATLSKSDARLVQLLKEMFSIENYIPGTNPVVARHLPVDTPPTTLRELIEDNGVQTAAEAKERPIEKLKDVVSKLKAFVRSIDLFSRLRQRDDVEGSSVKRRLLSDTDDDAHPDVLAGYRVDLDRIVDTLHTLLSRRMASDDALHLLSRFVEKGDADEPPSPMTAFREELLRAIGKRIVGGDRRQMVTKMQNRLQEWVQDVASSPRRRPLAEETDLKDSLSVFSEMRGISPSDVPDIQRIFREKASASLKCLGEWKAMTTRRFAQTQATSIEDLLHPVRERLRSLIDSLDADQADGNEDWLRFREQLDAFAIENPSAKAAFDLIRQTLAGAEEQEAIGDDGEDMKAAIAKLDASLRDEVGNGWSRIVEDAKEEMRRVLKASTAIVAHDAHFHSTTDHGLPNAQLLKLDHLPAGSDEILSKVHRRHRKPIAYRSISERFDLRSVGP